MGTAHSAPVPVLTAGTACLVTINPATGESLPPTTIPAPAPSGCATITDCAEAGTVPPPPTTVLGGGSFPVVVGSFCSTSVSGGPINVQMGPTSTVSSNCADGEITVQPGDLVLTATVLFEPSVGQCIAATAQPAGTIASCTVVAGTNVSGYEPSGTIVVSSGTLPVLTTVPGAPMPELDPITSAAGGCPEAITVTGPATTMPVPAPTTTIKR